MSLHPRKKFLAVAALVPVVLLTACSSQDEAQPEPAPSIQETQPPTQETSTSPTPEPTLPAPTDPEPSETATPSNTPSALATTDPAEEVPTDTLIQPEVVDSSVKKITVSPGQWSVVRVAKPRKAEITSSDPAVVLVTPSEKLDNGEVTQPGLLALSSGKAKVTVLENGESYTVTVKVTGDALPETEPVVIPQAQLDLSVEIVQGKLSTEEATNLIESEGFTARVVQEDGEPVPGELDFNQDRLNLTVEDGVVTGATWG